MDSPNSLQWRVLQSANMVLGTSTNLIIRSNNLKAMKAIWPFSTTARGRRGYDVDGVDRVDGGAVYGIYVDYLCRYLAGPCCCCGTFIHTYTHTYTHIYIWGMHSTTVHHVCKYTCTYIHPPRREPEAQARTRSEQAYGLSLNNSGRSRTSARMCK